MSLLLNGHGSVAHTTTASWHEQDADEIMESCDICITEACKNLEAAGWSKESVKVIGQCISFPTSPIM